ncbi:MAG TPA: nucleoside hydrolase, partial [Phycisphaerae bacterium]|nr:nucleoside hydrolase [Phycisphaerae bacterium]
DDAMAVGLALASPEIRLVGLASVGGNVSLDQATINMPRVLEAFRAGTQLPMARGLDQSAHLMNAADVHGDDGLGHVDLPAPDAFAPDELIPFYERAIAEHGRSLAIVAIGPLTNLAYLLRERPGLLEQAGRVVVMGGAIWCKGNVTPYAEFNFYRDPVAARDLLVSGLPISVVSLDVTQQVAIDESHVARMSRSASRIGGQLARMLQWPMAQPSEDGVGRFLVHDPLALGTLIWPQLFLQSRMGLDITTSGPQAGRSKPVLVKDKKRQVSVVISVNAADFLENLLERLCNESFVV